MASQFQKKKRKTRRSNYLDKALEINFYGSNVICMPGKCFKDDTIATYLFILRPLPSCCSAIPVPRKKWRGAHGVHCLPSADTQRVRFTGSTRLGPCGVCVEAHPFPERLLSCLSHINNSAHWNNAWLPQPSRDGSPSFILVNT